MYNKLFELVIADVLYLERYERFKKEEIMGSKYLESILINHNRSGSVSYTHLTLPTILRV